MVVKQATLDVEVKVDDSAFTRATAGIQTDLKNLEIAGLAVAAAFGKFAADKSTLQTLAIIAQEALKAAGSVEELEQQFIALAGSEEKGRAAFEAIRRMMSDAPRLSAQRLPVIDSAAPEPAPTFVFVKGASAADLEHVDDVKRANLDALEEIDAAKQTYDEAQMKRLERQAERYASFVDPAPYIVEGLKSGEMDRALKAFGDALGTAAAEALVHKLIALGIMAILQLVTGGVSQGATMAMRRGGVIKAGRGLLGVLPPRPGGYTFPFGDKWINAAEAGQPEALAVLPPGRAGQDLILGPLAKMFDIPILDRLSDVPLLPSDRRAILEPTWKPEVNVETRPVNNITVQMLHEDRHRIKVYNDARAGKVNKAVTVRS
jgi:hypothetical protein